MRAIALDFILCFFIVDQLTKWVMIEQYFKPAGAGLSFIDWFVTAQNRLPYVRDEITSFFNLVMVWNKGVSFGLMAGDGTANMIFLIALASVIALVFGYWIMRQKTLMPMIAGSLVVGGALGNIADRLRFGAVADFLDFHAYGYHFPAFNVADSCITIGIGLVIIHNLFDRQKTK